MKNFLWYTDSKIPEDKYPALEKIIRNHLSSEDTEDIMRTIAQKYRDEGKIEGILIGQEKGKLEGIQLGEQRGKLEEKKAIAKAMREKNYPIADIMMMTGLSSSEIKGLV